VRPARADDLEALVRLHEAAQDRTGIALQRARRSWWALITEGPDWNDHVLVAEQDDEVVGSVRLLRWPEDPGTELLEGAAATARAGRALLAAARERTDGSEGDGDLCSFDRLGDPYGVALHEVGLPTRRWHPTYVRVPDPIVLLRAVQPVLSRRLASSPFAAEEGELVLSLYSWSIRFTYEHGAITSIEQAPGIEDPEDQGDAAVAPESFPALVLGRFGAAGLAERVDDVLLGHHHDFMGVLFPRLSNDHVFPT